MQKHESFSTSAPTDPGQTTFCECSDPGCPVHLGFSTCLQRADQILYRIDMDDLKGTAMCPGCAADALGSGLFDEGE